MSFEVGQRVRVKKDTPETKAGGLEGEIIIAHRFHADYPLEYVVRVEDYPSPHMGKITAPLIFWAEELETIS